MTFAAMLSARRLRMLRISCSTYSAMRENDNAIRLTMMNRTNCLLFAAAELFAGAAGLERLNDQCLLPR